MEHAASFQEVMLPAPSAPMMASWLASRIDCNKHNALIGRQQQKGSKQVYLQECIFDFFSQRKFGFHHNVSSSAISTAGSGVTHKNFFHLVSFFLKGHSHGLFPKNSARPSREKKREWHCPRREGTITCNRFILTSIVTLLLFGSRDRSRLLGLSSQPDHNISSSAENTFVLCLLTNASM